mmetsp:Transcript_93231/g.266526  ORF Transcript_93231/g.266526 Transcript_93231/m.266526 type:complete len:540 (+) Transcript_93231:370-1989(+)|eukprot:CAMPEP_0119481852 /NCGR_PEP_ID=MMETSP1344-20130328/9986_1 /TAXON_ID=236787 /ORGANISM="Florenciella parvula, Strain CCMP2471" /LENGTH=539 /DNA_ID=CAMNT_0007516231 /DNA_START=322 /DNA_END=1941 /DNA_ORIENTATION=-
MEGQQTEAGASALVATVAPTGRRRLRHKLTKEEKRWKLKIGTAAQSMVLLGVVGFSGRAMWSAPSTPWSPAESAHAYPQTDRRLDETASSDTPSAMPTAVPSGTAMPSVFHDPKCDTHGIDTSTGGLMLKIGGIIFIFVGIAIVCDEYFQPALEAISEALDLSADVAGATFLAAGSSAPELFTSLSDAFSVCPASMGIGTIVGSAMFNILVIVALSCAVAGQSGASLLIDWRPVARDVTYYTISILMMAAFFDDGKVTVAEAAIMVVAYFSYIVFMMFNEKIMAQCSSKVAPDDDKSKQGDVDAAAAALEGGGDEKKASEDSADGGEDGEDDDDGPFWHRITETPEGANPLSWILYLLSLPFLIVFALTVPDCDHPTFTNCFKQIYWVSFLNCILWIGILCHFMVEWAHECAIILDVDPIVVALVVLATGTSIPDAIGSMVAAKNGEANMAISNAVGSNVFDILLGLGLPWVLSGLIKGEDMAVRRDGIIEYVGILFGTVFLFLLILIVFQWKMNSTVGGMMFFLYCAFVVYCLLKADG